MSTWYMCVNLLLSRHTLPYRVLCVSCRLREVVSSHISSVFCLLNCRCYAVLPRQLKTMILSSRIPLWSTASVSSQNCESALTRILLTSIVNDTPDVCISLFHGTGLEFDLFLVGFCDSVEITSPYHVTCIRAEDYHDLDQHNPSAYTSSPLFTWACCLLDSCRNYWSRSLSFLWHFPWHLKSPIICTV